MTGAAGRLVGRQDAGTPGRLALDLVDPAFAVPSQPGSVASCSGARGSRCSMASRSPPVIDSACAVVSQAAGCEDWMATTIVAPDVLNGAAGRGDTWGGLVSSPSKGGGHGRGWRPSTGGVGEGRQRHS